MRIYAGDLVKTSERPQDHVPAHKVYSCESYTCCDTVGGGGGGRSCFSIQMLFRG